MQKKDKNHESSSIAESYEECINEETLSTESPASYIKAIDKSTVHRICSGQVVLTLAVAIKELVENSLDAGATCIEVRLKEYGSTLIEVSDNGKGVQSSDFAGLTLKHHTSKLENFTDLVGVKTFGFRGEALSSLCALSDMTVTTRHSKDCVGTKLIYNNNGRLISETAVSRNVGMTVSLQNIFYTLPVRHKEFLRNLKKEFTKMVQILYAYCLISSNVRISCTNQCDNGKKTTVISTDVHCSMKERISSIFGVKQLSSLLEIRQREANNDILSEYGVTSQPEGSIGNYFTLEGFISSCAHGHGRSASDRQFYFINSRPCDPVKISRLVNEAYHHYNRHQFPMVVLNITMKDDDVDINVTPDKRQIFVNREKLLLAALKTTLICLYENIPSTYDIQNIVVSNGCSSPSSVLLSSHSTPNERKLSKLSERFGRSPSNCIQTTPKSSLRSLQSSFSGIKRSISSVTEDIMNGKKQPKLGDFSFTTSRVVTSENISTAHNLSCESEDPFHIENKLVTPTTDSCLVDDDNIGVPETAETVRESEEESVDLNNIKENLSPHTLGTLESSTCRLFDMCDNSSQDERDSSLTSSPSVTTGTNHRVTCTEIQSRASDFISSLKARKSGGVLKDENMCNDLQKGNMIKTVENNETFQLEISSANSSVEKYVMNNIVFEEVDQMEIVSSRVHTLTVQFSLVSIKDKLEARKRNAESDKRLMRKFRATISPVENKSAEDELRREISKSVFKTMEVLGQFNLGFIIVKLRSDLFIIDQHATDEKYNFETLQNTCVIQNQKLIIPQRLELTAVNEGILTDNIDIFIKNGFEFKIDENHQLGRRVSLVSIPHSRGWEFGKEDIDEMIFMLSDSPGMFCRPSRVRAMFASRACRKSVMIGTPLDQVQMRQLVDHMGEIEQPWNCPHGRPTMRHLINLDVITKVT